MNVGPSLLILLAISLPSTTDDRPADSLLALLPPDSGLTLTIENLRDHAGAFLASPTAGRLMALPAWRDSDQFQRLARARRDIEAGTGLSLTEIRDEILGDAAVLAMYHPRGSAVDEARGVLLLRPRDPERLTRLIDAVNRADARSLRGLVSRSHRGVPVTSREFRAGTKPTEWYAILDQSVFVWSNSEALVQAVIDRQADSSLPSLRHLPAFDRVRRAIPGRACLGLYTDARFLERQLDAAAEPRRDGERRFALALRSYARWVEYAGIALEWADGPRFHIHQEIAPDRLSPEIRAWADRGGSTESLVRGLPDGLVAIVAGNLYPPPILDALKSLMAPRDWSQLELLAQAMSGVEPSRLRALFGSIGPAWVVGIGPPEAGQNPASWVVSAALGTDVDAESRRTLAGMLRSALALDTLRAGVEGEPGRIVTEDRDGHEITRRIGGRPLAYHLATDRVVFGSSPDAIVRYLSGDPAGGAAFQAFRQTRLVGVDSFAYVDLNRLRTLLAGRAGPRGADELDQALGLLGLFQVGYATARIAPGFVAIDHTLGLVPGP